MSKNYSVYMLEAPNGKKYFGVTMQNIKSRWGAGHNYKNNEELTKDIKRFGWHNFKSEILFENLSKEEAYKKEVELIGLHQTNMVSFGYNLTSGGCEGTTYVEGSKEKIRDKAFGRKHSEETKTKLSKMKKGKKLPEGSRESLYIPVNQYSLEGEFIKTFKSATHACKELGIKSRTGHINECCGGKRKSAYGYKWEYAKKGEK